MKKGFIYLLLFSLVLSMTSCLTRPLPGVYEYFREPCRRASVASSEFKKGMTYAEAKELLKNQDAIYFLPRTLLFKDKYGEAVFLHFDPAEASSVTNELTLSKVSTYAEPWARPLADELRIEEGKTTLEDVIVMCGMPYVYDNFSYYLSISYLFPLRDGMHLYLYINSDFTVSSHRILTSEELAEFPYI